MNIPSFSLDADPIVVDGKWFDPRDYFAGWRDNEEKEQERRNPFVLREIAQALATIPEDWGRNGKIATYLNTQEVPTLGGGREWKAENVKKAVTKYFSEPEIELNSK